MHYIDNPQEIGASYAINPRFFEDIHNTQQHDRMKAHATACLSRALRDEAGKAAAAMRWEHYLFAEIAPHEWPDMSPQAIDRRIYSLNPEIVATARGYVFEALPHKWHVRVMNRDAQGFATAMAAILTTSIARPVVTLRGETGVAIADSGTIFFWPDKRS